MTLTLNPLTRRLPPRLSIDRSRRSIDSGGGRIALGRNARWRAQLQLGRLVVETEDRALATVGRPWLLRQADACAFLVAGEGFRALACCSPGFARRRGGSVYCMAHDRQVYAPHPDPEVEAGQ